MIGTQLGRWVVDRELGKGAMGTVYHAHAADAPAEVRALKILAPDLTRDPVARIRFQRESEVLCHLDHPNIVRFDGAGVQNECLYYVMEYISGLDCETRLRQTGRWPWLEVLDLAIQVTRGLKYAHDQGIIHRDLTPANLLLQPGSTEATVVKITDFGMARMFSQGGVTGSGNFVGTALYMAPEQAAGKPATKRSDFYALGCVLYALLTGRPPFNGSSLAELVHKHQFAQPERPSRLLVDLPHDVDELIVQLLSKDPAQRPADGSVLLKRLESIRGKLVRKLSLTPSALHASEGSESNLLITWPEEPEAKPEPTGSMMNGVAMRAIVLSAALIAVVALIGWKLTRPRMTAEEYFSQAKPLMDSPHPADWERAWTEYLEPMTLRYPSHPYRQEVDTLRNVLDDLSALRRFSVRKPRGGVKSEAQRFFEQGLVRCQSGDLEGGRRIWEQMIRAFSEIESEQPWVRLAQRGLQDLQPGVRDPGDSPTLQAALDAARRLRDAGETEKAEAVWKALENLYRADAAAVKVLEIIKADRERK